MTELKPCPHCGSELLTMYVNRLDVSYLECDECTGRVSIDYRRCSDPSTSMLIDGLIEKWNRRV